MVIFALSVIGLAVALLGATALYFSIVECRNKEYEIGGIIFGAVLLGVAFLIFTEIPFKVTPPAAVTEFTKYKVEDIVMVYVDGERVINTKDRYTVEHFEDIEEVWVEEWLNYRGASVSKTYEVLPK